MAVLSVSDGERVTAIAADRDRPQKHAQRARVVLAWCGVGSSVSPTKA
jgi:hypothetical protein